MKTDYDHIPPVVTMRNCSRCHFPLPANTSGCRHYGTHTAHQEYECMRLLHAEIERLNAALRESKAAAGMIG